MTLKRRIITLLDRPGGRAALSALTNLYARGFVGSHVAVGFDDVWFHRVGSLFYPDSRRFNYYTADIEWWPRQPEHHRQRTWDFYLHTYRPKAGDVIVDVGAGKGEDVFTFAEEVGTSGRVIAVEAHPGTFEILRHMCRLNRLKNTTCTNIAVVDRRQTVAITSVEDWQSNTLMVGPRQDQTGTVPVRGATVDEICTSLDVERIDFLKMNIEGAEKQAIEGMTRAIDRIGAVCIACHDFRADRGHGEAFRTRERVTEYLRDHHFLVETRDTDPRDWVRDHVYGRRD